MMDAPIWENFTLPSLKEAEGKSKRLNMSWLNHLALDATKEYQVNGRGCISEHEKNFPEVTS